MDFRTSDRDLCYLVIGMKLLPLVIQEPEKAFPAEIARKSWNLPGEKGWNEYQVRLALIALENRKILISSKVRRKGLNNCPVRVFSVTELGLLFAALASKTYNIATQE